MKIQKIWEYRMKFNIKKKQRLWNLHAGDEKIIHVMMEDRRVEQVKHQRCLRSTLTNGTEKYRYEPELQQLKKQLLWMKKRRRLKCATLWMLNVDVEEEKDGCIYDVRFAMTEAG